MIDLLKRNIGFACGTLLASTATLQCCVLLAASGIMFWRARSLPCPVDPVGAVRFCALAGHGEFPIC